MLAQQVGNPFIAGFFGLFGPAPCLRDRSPDEGAPPSLSHCEMPFLGSPLGRLGQIFVVITMYPSEGALFAEPSSSGGGLARLRRRSRELEPLFRKSGYDCSCDSHPLLG
jgi:hypothetical protein